MANGGRRLANCGKAEVFVGLMACTILLSAGMVAAYLLGPKELRLAAVVAGGLGLYTILLRRFLLLPTVLAAFLATAPLWAPLFLIPANATSKIWSFCVTLVIIVAAREVFLDVLDRTGDAAGGRNTFATLFGLRIAKLVGVILTLGAVIPFSVVVGTSLFGLPFARQVLAILVAAAVLSLAVIPVLQTLDPETDRAAIQNYVRSSRLGIALLPALILILWLH